MSIEQKISDEIMLTVYYEGREGSVLSSADRDSEAYLYCQKAAANIMDFIAQAWEEGALWHRANAVFDDRRMKVRFLRDLKVSNPYRQGEN